VAVFTNPHPPPRSTSRQRALFNPHDPGKILEFDDVPGARVRRPSRDPGARPNAPRRRSALKRQPDPNQYVLDFSHAAQPARAFRRELDRPRNREAAPIAQRAIAAIVDAGFVVLFVAIFACLPLLLLRGVSVAEVAAAWHILVLIPILVALLYKFLWAIFRKPTIGLQAAGLELRSFDDLPPSFLQFIVRVFAGWLGLGCCGLGLIYALVSQERLSMHDHISQTFLAPAGREPAENSGAAGDSGYIQT
jgi:uncharacterized RDD family membrane protein YckC